MIWNFFSGKNRLNNRRRLQTLIKGKASLFQKWP
jgi:hypothetical protein